MAPYPRAVLTMLPRPLHLELEILYRESDGRRLERRITVKQFHAAHGGGGLVLSAHCSVSGGFEEFEADRIEHCIDLASGEPVSDLPVLLQQRYALSRHGRLEQLQRALGDELAVLLAMGRADALLQQEEKRLIAAYLCEHQPDQHPAAPFTVSELAGQLRWMASPTPSRFAAAVDRLAAAPSTQRLRLYALCETLADVKVGRQGLEQPSLDLLQQRWFPLA